MGTTGAIGYIRVSKAREEMISPELQTAAITEWCARNKVALVDIVDDLDATGRNFARQGIQRVIERVEAQEASIVVVWKWSRFGRNVRDCLVNIDRLEVAGGRLVAATEEFDDSPVGRFGRGQFLLMAQFESERIGEQWKEAMARRLRQGLPANGRPRYGYDYIGKGFVPNPDTAPIVARMYREYLNGKSFHRIAAELTADGIPGPNGGPFYPGRVAGILDTGFAAGLIVHNGVEYEGIHEPIVDRATHDEYMRRRRANGRIPARRRDPRFPLTGIAKCALCGWTLTVMDARMLRCGGSTHYMTDMRCPGTYIAPATLERLTVEWLEGLAAEIDSAAGRIAPRKDAARESKREVTRANRDVLRLEKALMQLTRRLAEGVITAEAYRLAEQPLRFDLDAARDRLVKVRDEYAALTAPPPKIDRNLLRDWPRLDTLGKHEILLALLDRVEVRPRRGTGPRAVFVPKWGL